MIDMGLLSLDDTLEREQQSDIMNAETIPHKLCMACVHSACIDTEKCKHDEINLSAKLSKNGCCREETGMANRNNVGEDSNNNVYTENSKGHVKVKSMNNSEEGLISHGERNNVSANVIDELDRTADSVCNYTSYDTKEIDKINHGKKSDTNFDATEYSQTHSNYSSLQHNTHTNKPTIFSGVDPSNVATSKTNPYAVSIHGNLQFPAGITHTEYKKISCNPSCRTEMQLCDNLGYENVYKSKFNENGKSGNTTEDIKWQFLKTGVKIQKQNSCLFLKREHVSFIIDILMWSASKFDRCFSGHMRSYSKTPILPCHYNCVSKKRNDGDKICSTFIKRKRCCTRKSGQSCWHHLLPNQNRKNIATVANYIRKNKLKVRRHLQDTECLKYDVETEKLLCDCCQYCGRRMHSVCKSSCKQYLSNKCQQSVNTSACSDKDNNNVLIKGGNSATIECNLNNQAQFANRHSDIRNKHVQLANRDGDIVQKHENLKTRESGIAPKHEQLGYSDVHTGHKQTQLANRDSHIGKAAYHKSSITIVNDKKTESCSDIADTLGKDLLQNSQYFKCDSFEKLSSKGFSHSKLVSKKTIDAQSHEMQCILPDLSSLDWSTKNVSNTRQIFREHLGVNLRTFEKHSDTIRQFFSNLEQQIFLKTLVREIYPCSHIYNVNVLERYFNLVESGSSLTTEQQMRFEWLRFATFRNYHGNGNTLALARNAFYHEASQGPNATRCAYCGVMYSTWSYFVDIAAEHRRISPRCPFVNNVISETNIPIDLNSGPTTSVAGIPLAAASTTSIDVFNARHATDVRGDLNFAGVDTLSSDWQSGSNTAQTSQQHEESQHVSIVQHPTDEPTSPDNVPDTQGSLIRSFGFTGAYHTNIPAPRVRNAIEGASTRANVSNITTNLAPTTAMSTLTKATTLGKQIASAGAFACSTAQPKTNQTSAIIAPDFDLGSRNGIADHRAGVVVSNPKHPAYSSLEARTQSYRGWPEHLNQTPREMAEAGFLYTGVSDFTRCYACGGGLRNWEPGDDPILEHTRWFPGCEYINQLKGERYVQAVERRHREHIAERQRQHNEIAQGRAAMQTPQDALNTLTVVALKEVGYSEEKIREAINAVRQQTGLSDVLPQQALNWILDDDETPAVSAQRAAVTASANGQRTSTNTQNTTKNTSSEDSKSDISNPSSSEAGKQRDDTRINNDQNISKKDSRTIQMENERLRMMQMCKICMENDVNTILLPCGHLVSCESCAKRLKKCPICRITIKSTLKTFMS